MKKLLKTLRSIPLQAKPSVVADLVLPHISLRSQYSWRGGDRKPAYFDITAIKIARYIIGSGLVWFSLNIWHIHTCNINTKEHFPENSKLFRCSVLQTETSTTTGGTPTTFQGLFHDSAILVPLVPIWFSFHSPTLVQLYNVQSIFLNSSPTYLLPFYILAS